MRCNISVIITSPVILMFDAGHSESEAQSWHLHSDNMVERGRMGDATHRFITINGYKLFKCRWKD